MINDEWDQQTAKTTVDVEERVDNLELHMHQSQLEQNRRWFGSIMQEKFELTQSEARTLEAASVLRVDTAEDGLTLGLQGTIQDIMEKTRASIQHCSVVSRPELVDQRAIARTLS